MSRRIPTTLLTQTVRSTTNTLRIPPPSASTFTRATSSFSTLSTPRSLTRAVPSLSPWKYWAMLPSSSSSSSSIHTSAMSLEEDKSAQKQRPETRPCWKCSNPVPFMTLLCPNPDCKVVQTLAPGANYFEVLGLSAEPTFDLDLKDLRNKFFKIQQQIHPDSYSQNTNGDQVYAQQQSSLANKAYSTLKEPLSRANYLLDLLGAPIHESESLNASELLMEVMEARELLEEAQTEEEVQDLKNVNDARIKDTTAGLSKAFGEGHLEKAKDLAIQLQYWIRIQNVIRDWAAGKPVVADHV